MVLSGLEKGDSAHFTKFVIPVAKLVQEAFGQALDKPYGRIERMSQR